ncbi:MAG: hypothetical protein QOC77_1316 [Thermoleophilaceae bacterium]|jgi:hypothetical protein|nr:hypothetical protein [Thermoleophilaceae bacterium]
MRRFVWAGVGCIAVILVVGGWNVLAFNVLHGDVTPRKLFVSVENESGGGSPFGRDLHRVCHRMAARAGSWVCDVEDPRGSGGSSQYRVDVHGSCWDASGGSGALPGKISGCVHFHENAD